MTSRLHKLKMREVFLYRRWCFGQLGRGFYGKTAMETHITGHMTHTKSSILRPLSRNEGEGLPEAVANTTLEIMENL